MKTGRDGGWQTRFVRNGALSSAITLTGCLAIAFLLKVIALRSLGITQRLIGNLDEAQEAIAQSLEIA